ncbi:FAD-dependent oxidoreductase [Streptomyces canus]|uniref:FAD-dependent oxidoreductase n=1 Tax=Streptomyces canus TaxID=58343 RepID=UPI002E328E9A|nr:FAD-dependent monooxygenase [Streptomyces canus]
MEKPMSDAQVVVAGAGPVGLLTALGLARAGVDVTVIDALPGTEPRPHDMVYDWVVLPGIEELGLLRDMCRVGVMARTRSFRVLDTGEQIVHDLDVLADEVEHPFNVHMPPHLLTELVTARLAGHPRVGFAWDTRLTDVRKDAHGVTVTAETPHGTRTLRAGWLVGADGAHSQVRRSLGMGFPGMTWPKRFVAADIRFDLATLGSAPASWQLDPDDGAVMGQVDPSGLWRFIYAESRLLPEETVADRMPAVFKAALPDGADPLLESWAAHRVHERVADRFRAGRVLLAGDAAHVTNPTLALGMACGVLDAFALTRALAAVVHGEADDARLDHYAQDRRRVFLEYASPVSTKALRFLFHTDSATRFGSGVERWRRLAADPRLLRDRLLDHRRLRGSPLP